MTETKAPAAFRAEDLDIEWFQGAGLRRAVHIRHIPTGLCADASGEEDLADLAAQAGSLLRKKVDSR